MFNYFKNSFNFSAFNSSLKANKFKPIFEELNQKYPKGSDPWGLNIRKSIKSLEKIYPFYKHYFKVRVLGKENVEDKAYMVVSNHTGQIAIDGMLISTAFVLEVFPPRILRPMAERFITSIPFIGSWAAQGGAVLGDRQNCINLLKKGQSILVFPEGVKGIAKSTKDYYKLQNFTKGFYRICAKLGVEILPVSVVGAEEFFPYVYQAKYLANIIGIPALPISANFIPLPSPVDIHIGKPIRIPQKISHDSSDAEITKEVKKIENAIEEMLKEGLKKRRPFFANQNLKDK
ncbi:MAG: acyltransferase family protein [Bacteriovoracaceae bacterium]|jgi:1-acyl-sn-glycerol-3-phosphate acyltransferase|nr:acyltransferase family protein [Bacteriovoracaceae bacterium]